MPDSAATPRTNPDGPGLVESPLGWLTGSITPSHVHVVPNTMSSDYHRLTPADLGSAGSVDWQGVAWQFDRALGQVAVWATDGAAVSVHATITDFVRADGEPLLGRATVQAASWTLAGVGNPSLGSPQEPIADILSGTGVDTDATASAKPDGLCSLWFFVDTDADALPGRYSAELLVTTTASTSAIGTPGTRAPAPGDVLSFPLYLEVLPITAPTPHRFLDLWQNPFSVARAAGLAPRQWWSQAHFAAMRPHYQLLASAGQTVVTATAIADPWASQTLDPYGSMVRWTRLTDGHFAFDFSVLDAWVRFMADCGIGDQIDIYGMVSWNNVVTFADAATGRDISVTAVVGSEQWVDMWTQFLAALAAHLADGHIDAEVYMAFDERDFDEVLTAAALVHEVSRGRILSAAAMNYNRIDAPDLDRIHKISVLHDRVRIDDAAFLAVARRRRARGLVTSLYNCTGNYPNSFTRSSPAEGVWMQWKTLRLEVSGYLRWAFDSFNEDPDTTTDYRSWESGDAFLCYPGGRSSVRFEKIKEGIRDVSKAEYLLGVGGRAEEILRTALGAMRDQDVQHNEFGAAVGMFPRHIEQDVREVQRALLEAARQYLMEQAR